MSSPVFEPDPVFEVGDVVVSVCSGKRSLTRGKQYVVVKYEPRFPDTYFTWPAYVTVVDDDGNRTAYHTYRFKKVENDEQP